MIHAPGETARVTQQRIGSRRQVGIQGADPKGVGPFEDHIAADVDPVVGFGGATGIV